MGLDQDEIKNLADNKKWIEARITDLESEAENLKKILASIDFILRKSSFQSANAISKAVKEKSKSEVQSESLITNSDYQDIRPLTRAKDGKLLANGYISKSSIAIVPASDVILKTSTPPFTSFFLNRILEGMKTKDMEKISEEKLNEYESLNYLVEDEEEVIKKIIINNYREQNRLTEIFNTSAWTFSRMLEKK
jgi:hypothetical protein